MPGPRNNLSRLQYFVAIVEEGTITAAAERLGVNKAVVSRQLAALEDEHSVNLLRRSPRGQSLTHAGEVFYQHAKSAVTFGERAFATLDEKPDQLRGHIRISAPASLGASPVSKLLAQFAQQHPDVSIELDTDDRQKKLVQDHFDIAIRAGWLEDSTNKANLLVEFREILVASPDLAKKLDPNCTPNDLSDVPMIANSALKPALLWRFEGPDNQVQTVRFSSNLTLHSSEGVVEALKVGGTVAVLADNQLRKEMKSGELVQLVPQWKLRVGGVFAVTPPNQSRSAAVQALIRHLKEGILAHIA